jgi:hypothetical protein
MLISKIDDWLYTEQPSNDTRPAEVWTRKTKPEDLSDIDKLLYGLKDTHWLAKNYTMDQIEKLKVISIMKREGKIVGFSGIQDIDIGSRILSRLYQVPKNRVRFTRELFRPTIQAMVEQQLLLEGKDNQVVISREPRQSKYFKRFVDELNKRSTAKWTLNNQLYETVPGSWQYIAWRNR